MPAGSGGLAVDRSAVPTGVWLVSAAGVLLAAGGLLTSQRVRQARH